MTRLYIDDIRNPPDDDWIITRTITGAIRVLATMEVDTISLDHDMGVTLILTIDSLPVFAQGNDFPRQRH
jgi:hypothetical protein